MLSISPIAAGSGWEYLSKEVAAGAEDYYLRGVSDLGERPGVWLGNGLQRLNLTGIVTADQMKSLYGLGVDPSTQAPLGRAFASYLTVDQRILRAAEQHEEQTKRAMERARRRVLDLGGGSKAMWIAEQAEQKKSYSSWQNTVSAIMRQGERSAVAAYDLTFSPPKSVSVLWAAAPDDEGREAIWRAQHEGVFAGLRLLEKEGAWTRRGHAGVRQEKIDGVVAAAFDHRMSRAGDPQIHTHLAVSAKVQASDGAWLSLDARNIFQLSGAISAVETLHRDGALMRELGVHFYTPSGKIAREIAGVPSELNALFSSRRAQIQRTLDQLTSEYIDAHGREPSRRTLSRMSQWATLETRQKKGAKESTQSALERWRAAAKSENEDRLAPIWSRATGKSAKAQVQTDAEIVALALEKLDDGRSTWTRADVIHAVVSSIEPDSISSAQEIDERWQRLVGEVLASDEIVCLTPDLALKLPESHLLPDGSSAYVHHFSRRFATCNALNEEAYLTSRIASTITLIPSLETALSALEKIGVSADARKAIAGILASDHAIDILIGPAGSGKTTAMKALADAYWASGLEVLALTPSQTAANVIAKATGIHAENAAKWLLENARMDAGRYPRHAHKWGLRPGQLVVLDEASMVDRGTFTALAKACEYAGAKLLAVGDPEQLAAPDSPGALKLLAAKVDPFALVELHRFLQSWEKEASILLRSGNPDAIEAYYDRGRVLGGSMADNEAVAIRFAIADHLAGKSTLIVVHSNERAARVSAAFRDRLIELGEVEADGVALHDGNCAGVGDVIVARQNDREISNAHGDWIANRGTYRILRRDVDGSCQVAIIDGTASGHELHIDADYMTHHVELGYAGTTHAVQGATADTCHALVASGATRSNLYVSMTRGREANYAYVDTDQGEAEASKEIVTTPQDVLRRILERDDVENTVSAATMSYLEGERVQGLHNLCAIRQDLQASATQSAFSEALQQSFGEQLAQKFEAAPGWRTLLTRLDNLDLHGVDARQALIEAVQVREIDTAGDPARVVYWRLQGAMHRAQDAHGSGAVHEPFDGRSYRATDFSPALREVDRLIAERIEALADRAENDPVGVYDVLGPRPDDALGQYEWRDRAGVVLGYREAFEIQGPGLGTPPPPSRLLARGWYDAAVASGGDSNSISIVSDEKLHRLISVSEILDSSAPAEIDLGEAEQTLRLFAARKSEAIAAYELALAQASNIEQIKLLERQALRAAQLHADKVAELNTLRSQYDQRAEWEDRSRKAKELASAAQTELDARQAMRLVPETLRAAPTSDLIRERAVQSARLAATVDLAVGEERILHASEISPDRKTLAVERLATCGREKLRRSALLHDLEAELSGRTDYDEVWAEMRAANAGRTQTQELDSVQIAAGGYGHSLESLRRREELAHNLGL